ncbi:two-component system NtrC family sensor kinase [Microvirga flocculans]|uniref:histidine kinase n=1 Tax=Microvirga flocculans TaxID=217168 RepID=A0A7W6IBS8_9HYPH|nr:response regulator [Microvirga flocculans]MBB4038539.1 two-component system NtrC family sensor kinase [Microvirga flocculans]
MSTGAIIPAAEILLVEDSETQALQLRHMLETNGFHVTWRSTAEAALDGLNEKLPDLVIADYHLPGMNGDELTRQLRLNVRTRAIPVIMLTEARERAVERQGLESGADAYISKSAEQELIILRIKALLRRPSSPIGDSREERQSPSFGTFRRARILIADDCPARRTELQGMLAHEGYAVSLAADPAQTLRQVRSPEATWDCILVNLLSPNFDGIGLCRQLNLYRGLAPLPGTDAPSFAIVGLGNEEGGDLLARAFAAGVDDIVPSTLEADGMRVRIRALVRRKLMQDENWRIETELRERELALARARAEAALAEALAKANRELEEANALLKGTQAQLVQAAKMASLGELVAGIAHEINNPLAFIQAHQGTVERLLTEIATKMPPEAGLERQIQKSRDRVAAMKLGLARIQELGLNLRRFSRLDEGDFQTVNVPESIETVLALLGHKLGSRIDVRRRYNAVPDLYCSPALLNQVVMNIVGNAADAIKGTGGIDIETESDATTYTIRISDTGPGIPSEFRERIFEPFFTTKPVGSGTGLGLAIAYSIVQAHKGSISVEPGPTGGASFTITIPRRIVS